MATITAWLKKTSVNTNERKSSDLAKKSQNDNTGSDTVSERKESDRSSDEPTSTAGCQDEDASSETDSDVCIVQPKKRARKMGKTQKQAKGYKEVKKFAKGWLQQYPFLLYDEGDNSMKCSLCIKHSKSGPFVTGTRNFRKKTITVHLDTLGHKAARAAEDPSQPSVTKGAKALSDKRYKALRSAFEAVYFISQEELPNRKYKSLVRFLRERLGHGDLLYLRKGANSTYDSPDIFNQILGCLSKTLEDKMKADLRKSPCVAIGTDESTDRSSEKHIVVVIRYVNPQKELMTTFLKLRKIKDASACSITTCIGEILQEFGVPWKKVVGLGTDGASVMASDLNGVTGIVHEHNPFCVCIHCVCHRLHLAVSQACKQIPAMRTLQDIIGTIYNHIEGSPKRKEMFKDLADLLEEDTVKFKRIYEIRWLSLGDCIFAALKNYETLMVLLSQEAANDHPVATGLYQQLSSFKYLALFHLAADIFSAVNHLSKLFQHRDVSFSAVRDAVQDCRAILTGLKEEDGSFLVAVKHGMVEDPPETFTYKGVQVSFA